MNPQPDLSNPPYCHIPNTISVEAQAILKTFQNPSFVPGPPAPDNLAAWKEVQEQTELSLKQSNQAAIQPYQPTILEKVMGEVAVLDIRPKGWINNGKVLIYTHGGAYAFFSAYSTLAQAVLLADQTQYRIISVNYTVAPWAKWQQVTDQVISVIQSVHAEGYNLKQIGLLGDSAGGSLAASSVLKMRDQGKEMPGAVVMWSPWADITETGDTYHTLKHAEPMYFYHQNLKNSADAYADPVDQKHPYVSPVYGDFSQGFPPSLIQGGTKEIFLSNSIRLYQALDTSGQIVKLDLYEGMWHVFQTAPIPEAHLARQKVKTFFDRYLD